MICIILGVVSTVAFIYAVVFGGVALAIVAGFLAVLCWEAL
jgi:hypothetical protein